MISWDTGYPSSSPFTKPSRREGDPSSSTGLGCVISKKNWLPCLLVWDPFKRILELLVNEDPNLPFKEVCDGVCLCILYKYIYTFTYIYIWYNYISFNIEWVSIYMFVYWVYWRVSFPSSRHLSDVPPLISLALKQSTWDLHCFPFFVELAHPMYRMWFKSYYFWTFPEIPSVEMFY